MPKAFVVVKPGVERSEELRVELMRFVDERVCGFEIWAGRDVVC